MYVILVDWLLEVHDEFQTSPNTYFLAISYLNRIMHKKQHIKLHKFQLYGATCLWIASKFEDIWTNSSADYVWICADIYTVEEFKQVELEILTTLCWDISQITSYYFLHEQQPDQQQHKLGM